MNEENKQTQASSDDSLEKRLRSYEDLEGLSTRQLNFGLWYLEHRTKLKAGVTIVLLVIGVSLWLYTFYGLVNYYTRGVKEDANLVSGIMAQNLPIHAELLKNNAKNLLLSGVSLIQGSGVFRDAYVTMENPNKNFRAEFLYCFSSLGVEIECSSGFILPEEQKVIMTLGKKIVNPSQVNFYLKNLAWTKIDAHQIPVWTDYRDNHLNFSFTGIKAGPWAGTNSTGSLSNLSFSALNNTPFNYREVYLNILVYSGNYLNGINRFLIENFRSGETRDISLVSTLPVNSASQIKIVPEVNLFSPDNYLKFEGGTGQVK